jgi:Na+/melibiose symporter-like transporter
MVSAQLLAPLFAFVLTPVFSNRRDKKIVLIWSSVASVVGYGWPLLLRSLGLFMSNDNPLLFPLMLVNAAVVTIFDIIVYTVGYSMMADVVEARQLETGRREEGLLSSFQLFAQKAFSGMGILVGGFFLELISFPTQVESADVPAETVFDLGLVYGPVFMVIYLVSLAPLVFYRINRKTHLENLAKLSE